MSAARDTPAAVPAPDTACRTCRFGRGEDRACVLLEEGRQDLLLAEGPCRVEARIRGEASRLVRRRYPFARNLEEDLGSEVVLHIVAGRRLLVPAEIRHLPALDRRLREMVRSALIDALREHRLVTRIRCGACAHFEKATPPPGCHLEWLPDLGTEARPNPWYGSAVERLTDPRDLRPPCEAFSWRRPETHDIFAEEIPGLDPGGTRRERAVAVVVGALDRLALRDERGLRAAAAVFLHYLRGKSVAELARDGGVSEKTVKRLLAEGRERLLAILREEYAIEDPAEVLA